MKKIKRAPYIITGPPLMELAYIYDAEKKKKKKRKPTVINHMQHNFQNSSPLSYGSRMLRVIKTKD